MKLVPGTSACTTKTMMSGVIHVGMLYVAMTRCGFVLYVRMPSMPRRKNTHMLGPRCSLVILSRKGVAWPGEA